MLVVLWTVLMVMSILVIHEAGHFVMALLVRLPVRSLHLGIPLGPQIRTKLGKYPFTISLLPFGMAVMIDEEMMWRIPLPRRVLVFLSGPFANLAAAIIVSLVVFGPEEGIRRGLATVVLSLLGPLMIATGQVPVSDISGPVGIVSISARVVSIAPIIGTVMMFTIVSAALGAINLLPIPGLDGGQIMMHSLVRLGMPKKWEQWSTYGSLTLLIVGMILITVKDIVNLL
ncbi:MAG: membrane-associated zinc metalloprotease, regulator of sigma E protease [candidate division WWE3 bacterium CSP1-7]|uniref:Membrane-associated zinc metalloprotease, regulator of sigma E protease n=1 Tax=candidate division WWE3 bacterium CSP1-7 TaxID=1576480 RepID=A0A0T5ZWP4_UNCKA|nr:MAG: membrane-associated zinc metalloprotease, regulator of sigma E protease [candidate division WWE3 bacterium CSP1-7]